ncbi:sodium:proton antiporter [Ornithinibacillus sp. L9]|uniref:Sodium:proton antiporter n=1 Tax=Ornithinibacillus caprae TaxID=2678566 RepID=A0A6N8FPB1_9BACI|nr:sodium:proton antiporter [Ornithinibacillus caprae]MUK89298.1 sodium:proton antiporter [Ornithinibacillus caprae]
MVIGDKFTIKEKILLAKFSLLNIDIILKGVPNTEAKNASDIKACRIDSALSFEVLDDMYVQVGITIIVASAVKIEILVNIFRFFLSKKDSAP